jgi:hypothetical protein
MAVLVDLEFVLLENPERIALGILDESRPIVTASI